MGIERPDGIVGGIHKFECARTLAPQLLVPSSGIACTLVTTRSRYDGFLQRRNLKETNENNECLPRPVRFKRQVSLVVIVRR